MGPIWEHVAYDLACAAHDANSDDVDACVNAIVDQCLLTVGVKCDPSVVMSLFAHMCPHILAPSSSAVVAFCLSGVLGDIVGCSGSRRMRGILVRHILQIPGEPEPLEPDVLLQDSLHIRCLVMHDQQHRLVGGGGGSVAHHVCLSASRRWPLSDLI